jgi:hypothetical protein
MNFKSITEQFVSQDYEDAEEELLSLNSKEVQDFLIKLLDSEKYHIRARACTLIREKKLQNALPSLFKNIFKEENKNNTGSMVFALTELDCSQHFVEIFKIYMYGHYEAWNHADTILCEQDFEYTIKDFKEVEDAWKECQEKPELCPCYDNTKENIQKDIEYFRQVINNKEKS